MNSAPAGSSILVFSIGQLMFRHQVKIKFVLEKGSLGSFDLVLKPLHRQEERQNGLVSLHFVACIERLVESQCDVMCMFMPQVAKHDASVEIMWH